MCEPTILESWDGVVCHGDRFYADMRDAVMLIADNLYVGHPEGGHYDLSKCPEFVTVCIDVHPVVDVADWICEHVDENYPTEDNSVPFGDWVEQHQRDELNKLVADWIASVKWSYTTPDPTKIVPIRAQIEAHLKTLACRIGRGPSV